MLPDPIVRTRPRDVVTAEERALIDAALAAGMVKVCPPNTFSNETLNVKYDEDTRRLKYVDKKGQFASRDTVKRMVAGVRQVPSPVVAKEDGERRADKRREAVAILLSQGRKQVEIARIMGVRRQLISKDVQIIKGRV